MYTDDVQGWTKLFRDRSDISWHQAKFRRNPENDEVCNCIFKIINLYKNKGISRQQLDPANVAIIGADAKLNSNDATTQRGA